MIIFTNFHEDWAKIVDFLLIANYLASPLFYYSHFTFLSSFFIHFILFSIIFFHSSNIIECYPIQSSVFYGQRIKRLLFLWNAPPEEVMKKMKNTVLYDYNHKQVHKGASREDIRFLGRLSKIGYCCVKTVILQETKPFFLPANDVKQVWISQEKYVLKGFFLSY